MLLRLLEKSLLYIVIILLCLISNRGSAAALSDLETSSVNDNTADEIQLAVLPSLPKPFHPRSKDAILYPELFGSTETESNDITMFPKWTGVLARYQGKRYHLGDGCKKGEKCPVRDWQHFLATVKNKPLKETVSLVNRYINQVKYVTDEQNWKTNDYWQTPIEFFERNGDCEDYAIAKYISLRSLGVPEDTMRLVVVNDEHLRAIHAILVVYIDGKAYILDNQIKQMVEANIVKHYQPIYSINEHHWWRHKVL